MSKSKYRLRKGPDIQDFVCETIAGSAANESLHQLYNYFTLRSEARAFAKQESDKGFRVRTFKISYRLIADTHKRKARK